MIIEDCVGELHKDGGGYDVVFVCCECKEDAVALAEGFDLLFEKCLGERDEVMAIFGCFVEGPEFFQIVWVG